MPAGLAVTEPAPVPPFWSVSTGSVVKEAIALRSAVIERTQVAAVPVHAPRQPMNAEPGAATAVSAMLVPLVGLAPRVVPQLMPAGVLVPEPLPEPPIATASTAFSVNVAVAVRSL